MKIDVHNHFYPRRFLDELDTHGAALGIGIEQDEWRRPVIVQRGNRVVTITTPMNDIQRRLEDMEKAGIDVQVLTLSAPSVDLFSVEIAERLSRVVNDEIARICTEHPEHFVGFATLPYLDAERAVGEMRRAVEELGFKGICIGTHIRDMALDDPRLDPVYACAQSYALPVHIHPRAPRDEETYRDYRLGPMIGFEMELCVAVVRLVMGGVLSRFPDLNFIVSHLGGAVPYLAERIENCYDAYPECRVHLDVPAKDALRRLYYDTVSFFEPALLCAHAFAGAERLILGSDYPHVIGDIDEAVSSIEALPIPDEDKARIFSGNLMALVSPS